MIKDFYTCQVVHGPIGHVTCSNRKVNRKVNIRFLQHHHTTLATSPRHHSTTTTTTTTATTIMATTTRKVQIKETRVLGRGSSRRRVSSPKYILFFSFFLSLILMCYHTTMLNAATSADHPTSREGQRGTGGLQKTATMKKGPNDAKCCLGPR